jgi:hypothetical protein
MKRFLTLLSFLALISTLSLSPISVKALDCAFLDVPEAAEQAELIVQGNIISKDNDNYEIEVEKSWKDSSDGVIFINYSSYWGDMFLIGEQGLLFLNKDETGKLIQPLCTRTIYKGIDDNTSWGMDFNESVDYLNQQYGEGFLPTTGETINTQTSILPILLLGTLSIVSIAVITFVYIKLKR